MKSIAYMLIMASALCAGLELIRPQKLRIELLDSLCKSLELMHAELSCRPCLICELFEMLSFQDVGLDKGFFEMLAENMCRLGTDSFNKIWNDAVSENLKQLDPEQLSTVKSLGTMLGSYELTEQLAAIENCRNKLLTELESLNGLYPLNRKVCVGLSCSLGAILVIVLV